MLWAGWPEHEGDGRAKRRDLRQRQIDKDHFAGEDLNAEIGVDADQHTATRNGGQRNCSGIDHRIAAADVRRFDVRVEQRNVIARLAAARRPDAASVTTDALQPCSRRRQRRVPARAVRARRCRTPRARMVSTIPARCEGLGGTPGLVSIKPTKSRRKRRAK